MTEHATLFTAAMVRAIRSGAKTQTRRVLTFHNSTVLGQRSRALWNQLDWSKPARVDRGPHMMHDEASSYLHVETMEDTVYRVRCRYSIGDILLVKEAAWVWCERRPNGMTKTGKQKWHYVPLQDHGLTVPAFHCADHPDKPQCTVTSPETGNQWGWRKKIARFLPRWAVRVKLEITDIRPERVQAISFNDIVAEGAYVPGDSMMADVEQDHLALAQWASLWESINAQRGYCWDSNPWVWALTFRGIK